VLEKFHKWIKVFGKKQSERMPTRKLWDHAIEVKKGFVPKKGKVYPLSREGREEVREFVKEQLRKGYIQPSKSPQTAPVFFVGKKDGKKRMVQDYRYLNEWTVKKKLPTSSDFGCFRKYWDKEGVHEDGSEVGVQQCENQGG